VHARHGSGSARARRAAAGAACLRAAAAGSNAAWAGKAERQGERREGGRENRGRERARRRRLAGEQARAGLGLGAWELGPKWAGRCRICFFSKSEMII
jgi:hypothetical protein